MKLKYLNFICLTMIFMHPVYAGSIIDDASIDADSFCKYFTEKNNAKITHLLFPNAIARLDNNHYDTNSQKNLIVGLSKDLADLSKARHVGRLIQEECLYYKLDQEGQLQIKYSLPTVKYQALKLKLQEIKVAKNEISKILSFVKKRMDSHNETLITYNNIKSSFIKLEDDEHEAEMDLAVEQIPNIKHTNLTVLLKDLAAAREKRQKRLNELEKQDNWSVQLEGGAQRDFSNKLNNTVEPYVAVSVRYNLGSVISDSQMNNSLDEYAVWQEHQVTGTQQQLYKTIISINMFKAANDEHLAKLIRNYAYYSKLSDTLTVSDSTKAVRLKQEIEVNKIMLSIEINYTKHMQALLRDLV